MSKLLTLYTVATDRFGGHIRDFAFEWVARLPPLYPAGDPDIYSPFEIEFLARFDDNE